jgi:hypothetical protein
MTIEELKKIIEELPDEMEVFGGEGLSESRIFVKILARAEVTEVDDKPALFLDLEDSPDEGRGFRGVNAR